MPYRCAPPVLAFTHLACFNLYHTTKIRVALAHCQQMVQTSLHPTYSWHPHIRVVLDKLDFGPVLFPDPSPLLFGITFGAFAGVVWLSLVDAIYVGYVFHTNMLRSVWPLRVLRAVVALIITAGE